MSKTLRSALTTSGIMVLVMAFAGSPALARGCPPGLGMLDGHCVVKLCPPGTFLGADGHCHVPKPPSHSSNSGCRGTGTGLHVQVVASGICG